MDRPKYYKLLFLIAAIWNIAGGIAGWITKNLSMQDMWFVIAFGVGFLFLCLNISKNQGMAVLGIIEKLSTFVITYASVPILMVPAIISAVDMVFIILFVEFLIWSWKNSTK